MPSAQPDDREVVNALLTLNGLQPSPEEVDGLVAAYPGLRDAVAKLYTMPGVRYAEPAVTFDARI